jgi:hypothetical protein
MTLWFRHAAPLTMNALFGLTLNPRPPVIVFEER